MTDENPCGTRPSLARNRHCHFIGGAFHPSRATGIIQVFNPATGELIDEVPAGNEADIDDAVIAAQNCFSKKTWRGRSAADRAQAMWRLSDLIAAHEREFVDLEVRDNGMPMAYATATIGSAINSLRYYAGWITKLQGHTADISNPAREMHAYTVQEPIGVVGAITPWNAPLAVLVSKIAPAIAAGCSIISKPAEQTPLSAIRFAELLSQSKLFPDGLINIVSGYGHIAGAALAAHPGVDKITFTGSAETGKKLVHSATGNLKRVTLELGGKSPIFVFDDADIDMAIAAAVMAIFSNSGQACIAGSRLYIQPGIFDRVVEGVAKAAAALQLGNGLDPRTQMGPLISQKQLGRVLSYIESGIDEGAELVTGGKRHGDTGYFVAPTVFSQREPKSIRIVREEIFGPVLVAMPFDGLDALETLANATEYGLASGIFTSNLSTAHRAAKLIRAGNVWINCYGILDKAMPFGGFRQSGWGRESGLEGIAPFLETKSVYTML